MESLFPAGISHYLLGGALLGLGVSLLFATTGLIGGMSSVFTTSWGFVSRLAYFAESKFVASRSWRLVYALGLVMGAAGWWLAVGMPATSTTISAGQLLLGGLVAGFGARMSNGCTSGHGICGMASFNLPSILAVCIFLLTAMVTANLVKLLGGA
jgi:uncharacterized protein